MTTEEKVWEDVNLNSQEADVQNEQSEKVFTAKEVEEMKKKLQSDSEKGVQKLIKEKKDWENKLKAILHAVAEVSKDKKNLIDIYDNDPEVAKVLLDQYYDWISIEAYKSSIGYKEDLSDPKVAQRKILEEAKKISDKQLVQRSKEEFIKKLEMTSEEQTLFEEAFSERMELKNFNVSDIDRHLEKAYKEISEDVDTKKLKSQETIARSMATWDWKGGNEWPKKTWLQEEISSFLKKYS